jgi:hypothetical protein
VWGHEEGAQEGAAQAGAKECVVRMRARGLPRMCESLSERVSSNPAIAAPGAGRPACARECFPALHRHVRPAVLRPADPSEQVHACYPRVHMHKAGAPAAQECMHGAGRVVPRR